MNQELDLEKANEYQAIYWEGERLKGGWRHRERWGLINWKAMKGKTVLDLGSNNGMMCVEAAIHGASRVVGVEFYYGIDFAKEFAEKHKLDIEYWRMNFARKEFLSFCPEFDIILCCSVFKYMPDKEKMAFWLDAHARETLWIETNYDVLEKPVLDILKKHTSFTSYKSFGQSEGKKDGSGHFMIRCRRDLQWNKISVTFVSIDDIVIAHDVEEYKNWQKYNYPPDGYAKMRRRVDELKISIKEEGQNFPLFGRRANNGKIQLVDGTHRNHALHELKEEKFLFYAPVRILPQGSADWQRSHGFNDEDYGGEKC